MKAQLNLKDHQTLLLEAVYKAIENEWNVEFKRIFPSRTNRQNKYYWALVRYFVIDTGYSKDESHEIFTSTFGFKKRVKLINQKFKTKSICRSTSDYSTKEMSIFIDKVLAYMAIAGIEVPSIEDYYADYCTIENYLDKEVSQELE